MPRRVALILLSLICPLLLLLLAAPAAASAWLAAPLVCAVPVLLMLIGWDRYHPSLWVLPLLWSVLSGSWLVLRWLSMTRDLSQPSAPDALLVLVVMLFGLGLVPLVSIGILYGRWFGADDREASGPGRGREGMGS